MRPHPETNRVLRQTSASPRVRLRRAHWILGHALNWALATPNFERFVRKRGGTFVGTSVRDGIERHYAFTEVGDLPLVLNVARSTREIEAEWRAMALVIAAVVLVLCGLTVVLSLLFGRELRRRAEMHAEMARLSRIDPLTGSANRRRFEGALADAGADARRTGNPLSLLVVDADHFKRFNDRYGHAVGDEVLKGLAACLSASVHRPGDLACQVGGEEFALILPGTDEAGALRVADEVHAQLSGLAVGSAGIEPGTVTVSIGLASGILQVHDLYGRADAALYEARRTGGTGRDAHRPGFVSRRTDERSASSRRERPPSSHPCGGWLRPSGVPADPAYEPALWTCHSPVRASVAE